MHNLIVKYSPTLYLVYDILDLDLLKIFPMFGSKRLKSKYYNKFNKIAYFSGVINSGNKLKNSTKIV